MMMNTTPLQVVVGVADACGQQAAKTGIGEHLLDQHSARDNLPQRQPERRHLRQQRIMQCVLHKDRAAAETLGFGEQHEILFERRYHQAARQQPPAANGHQHDRQGRQDGIVENVQRKVES